MAEYESIVVANRQLKGQNTLLELELKEMQNRLFQSKFENRATQHKIDPNFDEVKIKEDQQIEYAFKNFHIFSKEN